MLFLSRADVERVLDRDELIDAVGAAMASLSADEVSMPQRIAAEVPERDAFLGVMPVAAPGLDALTTKLVAVFPHNVDVPSHQALIVAFDPATGTPLAVLDGTAITAARTAAGSALSTRLLAREDARALAILGTGVQARAHAVFVRRVRDFDEVRVAGRDPAKTRALAEELGARPIEFFEEACMGADVVCATTHATEPVVRRGWLSPGTHVTSVGFNPEGIEVDAETVRDALVVVESRAAALAPFPAGTNDLLWPIRNGVITAEHVHAEIGELVAGTAPGRDDDEQITLYKSVGVAVQDAAAAMLVLRAAREQGLGTEIEL